MATQSPSVAAGTPAPEFNLPSTTGEMVSIADFAGRPALLVAFVCNHCPYVRHVESALARVAADYEGSGLATVAISANDVASYPTTTSTTWLSKRDEPGSRSHICTTRARRSPTRTAPCAHPISSCSTPTSALPIAVSSTARVRIRAFPPPGRRFGPRSTACSPANRCPNHTGRASAAPSSGERRAKANSGPARDLQGLCQGARQ